MESLKQPRQWKCQIRGYQMGGSSSVLGRDKKCTQNFGWKTWREYIIQTT